MQFVMWLLYVLVEDTYSIHTVGGEPKSAKIALGHGQVSNHAQAHSIIRCVC